MATSAPKKKPHKNPYTTYQIVELVPLGNAFDIRVKGRKKPFQIQEAAKFSEESMQHLQQQAEKKGPIELKTQGDQVLDIKQP